MRSSSHRTLSSASLRELPPVVSCRYRVRRKTYESQIYGKIYCVRCSFRRRVCGSHIASISLHARHLGKPEHYSRWSMPVTTCMESQQATFIFLLWHLTHARTAFPTMVLCCRKSVVKTKRSRGAVIKPPAKGAVRDCPAIFRRAMAATLLELPRPRTEALNRSV